MAAITTSKVEYLPIIMAGGKGSQLIQMTSDIPKSLLPIANKPMIYYPIKWLETSGFEEVKIVTTKLILTKLQDGLKDYFLEGKGIKLDYVVLPDHDESEDLGTVDAIKFMLQDIKMDVIVVSCDFICDENFCLRRLDQVHKSKNASISMLLSSPPNLTDVPVPVPESNRSVDRDFVGFDKTNRIVFLSPESYLEDKIELRMTKLRAVPHIELRSNLVDCHLYIISRPFLNLVDFVKSFSLSSDFIPWLAGQSVEASSSVLKFFDQSKSPESEFEEEINDLDRLIAEQNYKYLTSNSNNLNNNNNNNNNNSNNKSSANINVYALIHDSGFGSNNNNKENKNIKENSNANKDVVVGDSFCMRANTLATYCKANQIRGTSLIGQGTKVGNETRQGTETKQGIDSKPANETKPGQRSHVRNSTMSNSLICSDAKIADEVVMKNSFVGHSQSVPQGTYTSEEICKEEHDEEDIL
ncbi:hypothetical protein HELRODRAFT_177025 [Helobdella robusta]|uniref:Translation initiation factor eIF2B subunit gamma n=1 Tax=Helobdella robusta TaxID=6412 RepID=T1FB56_HELRO|nr:hypothetical protein HELRODRAFT_177025 [Helobdella robusta]ESN98545.1 hypothetical protein HELRODRAFT_177025 [Helobdella robusta]